MNHDPRMVLPDSYSRYDRFGLKHAICNRISMWSSSEHASHVFKQTSHSHNSITSWNISPVGSRRDLIWHSQLYFHFPQRYKSSGLYTIIPSQVYALLFSRKIHIYLPFFLSVSFVREWSIPSTGNSPKPIYQIRPNHANQTPNMLARYLKTLPSPNTNANKQI